MKNLTLLLILSGIFFAFGCNKKKVSDRYVLLTEHVWVTDSLSANNIDAGGPGGMLEKFKGNVNFNEDGTGYFGTYSGTWRFNVDETQLVIVTDSLPLPINTDILELTKASLKIKTLISNPTISNELIRIRMTFKAK